MRNSSAPRGRPTLAAAAALLSLTAPACQDDGPVVVGVSTSASYIDAARMALDDARAEQPLPGLDTIMIPEGTNEAVQALRAAGDLLAVEELVAVVGHSNSAASLAAAPLYNDREVVQLSPTATAEVYSRAGPYSFRLVPPDDRQGAFLAEHLHQALPSGGRLALFYVNDDYGRGLRKAFLDHLDRDAFTVLPEMPHTETEILASDIDRAGESLRETHPDVVVWLARGTILDRYLEAVRTAVPGALIVGSDAAASIRNRPGDPELRRGIRYVGFVDLESSEPLRSFAAGYQARFGGSATGPHALTYDAMRLLVSALQAGARDGPAVRRHLLSLGRGRPPYEGITGPVSFDSRGDVERPYVMLTVEPPGSP